MPTPRRHPVYILEKFLSDGTVFSRDNVSYSVEGLARLFKYGDYVRARSESGSEPEVTVSSEADRFPYTKGPVFQVNY